MATKRREGITRPRAAREVPGCERARGIRTVKVRGLTSRRGRAEVK